MFNTALSTLLTISIIGTNTFSAVMAPKPTEEFILERQISLNNRLFYPTANQVYKDNILLNMAYLRGIQKKGIPVNWDEERKPFTYSFILEQNQTFAFHDAVFDKYNGTVSLTTNSHFDASEGYKSDGRLYGMGVCHLASIINYAASDAGLSTEVPSNHNFAPINEVPREYGVAIYATPDSAVSSQRQNLYITNNFDKPVKFQFEFDGDILKVKILKIS